MVPVPGGASTGNVAVTVNGLTSSGASFAVGMSLNTSRYLHTSTLLPNGQVLIAGGESCPAAGSCTYLNTAELYDPSTQAFSYTGSMATARVSAAVLLPNGTVLIAGGYTCDSSGNCVSLSSAEIYNPNDGTFSSAGNMNVDRYEHTMTLLPDGTVLIAGGESCTSTSSCNALNSAEIYDPIANTFTMSNAVLNYARFGATAVWSSGKLLVVGGSNGSSLPGPTEFYASTFFYQYPNLNTPRYNPNSLELNNGYGLIVGGSTCAQSSCPSNSSELFINSRYGSYVQYTTGQMLVPRLNNSTTILNNGQVLLAGGFSSCGSSSCVSEASTEVYDPVANSFTTSTPLSATRAGHSATLLLDGTVLLSGGISNGVTSNSGELYQPASMTPTNLTSITISPSNISFLSGSILRLTATGTMANGTTQVLQSVTWTSSDSTVATVTNDSSDSGFAYGVANGSITVSACAGTICGSTNLIVGPPAPVSITLSPTNSTVPAGLPTAFSVTEGLSDGTSQQVASATVTWNSTAPQVASVDTNGVVTTHGAGTATIQASLGALGSSANVTVTAPAPTSITVTPALGGTTVGGVVQLAAIATYTDGSTGNVTAGASWSSSASTVATASSGGLITGKSVGLAPITATINGLSGSASVNVTNGITLPKITATLAPVPNAQGWNNTPVTVAFVCAAGSSSVAACPAAQIVATEGMGQVVGATVTDSSGNTATATVTVNIDETQPALTITSPTSGATTTESPVTVTGAVSDSLSGVSAVTCNGTAASISGGVFSCSVNLTPGLNLLAVNASDVAGNLSGTKLYETLDAPMSAPTSLLVSPATANSPWCKSGVIGRKFWSIHRVCL